MTKKFVPATDEVWRLQNGKDAECRFFQQMSVHGHYGPRQSSQQGIYICAPSGKFLASINSTNPEQIIALMNRGLKAWNALPADERKLTDATLVRATGRKENVEPRDGLILAMYARDIPQNCDPEFPCNKRWNRDTVWFSKREAQSMVPDDPAVDQTYELPELVVNRFVAMHLVDTPNGQTEHFRPEEVSDSQITARIVSVDGGQVELELKGKTKSSSTRTGRNKSPRGVVTNLLGSATFDPEKQKFTRFEMVALGRRWGYTPFNDRRRDQRDSNPLGFVFQLAPADEPPNVPAFIYAYNVPWVNGR